MSKIDVPLLLCYNSFSKSSMRLTESKVVDPHVIFPHRLTPPFSDIGDKFLYQRPLQVDMQFLPKLTALLQSREQERLIVNAGFRFRNPQVAALVSVNYSSQKVAAIEAQLETHGALRLNIRDATIRIDGKAVDARTIGAAERSTGGEMSNCVWIRDQTQCALSKIHMYTSNPDRYRHEFTDGKEILMSVLTMMSTPAQLKRFNGIIQNRTNQQYVDNPLNWPYIFLQYSNLNAEKEENWSHKQDAWQMLVWTTFEAFDAGIIQVGDLSDAHKQFLGAVVPFLEAVDFTERENSGSWEEIEAIRTSTMAWDTMAIKRIGQYIDKKGFEFLSLQFDRHKKLLGAEYQSLSLEETVRSMTKKGFAELTERIPFESPDYPPGTPQCRHADAALLYLLDLDIPYQLAQIKYPQEKDEKDRKLYERELELLILDQVLTLSDHRTNGIHRYGSKGDVRDAYQAAGFWSNTTLTKLGELYGSPTGDTSGVINFVGRDRIVPDGQAAAWTHFVAQISAWASRKYIQTKDAFYYKLGEEYANRMLSMITGEHEYSVMQDEGQLIIQEIPPWRITECFVTFIDPITNQPVTGPSPNTPLNWSIAKTKEAIAFLHQATTIK